MRFEYILASAAVAAAAVLQVGACAPSFPVSYFPHVRGDEASGNGGTVVSTNALERSVDAYRVSPHLGTELAMVGAHYYPSWTGKMPKGNRVSTLQADKLDFLEAGAAAGRSRGQVAEDWSRFVAFRDGVCRRLEGGEKVEVPGDAPDYALEFYLYKLGHAQWLVFRKDEDPVPFGALLALPKERRLYRTVWVHVVRIANARTFPDKDRHLEALRRSLDAGYRDTAALESFALRFLSATCGNRYDPLVLTAFARAPWEEWPGFAKRIFQGRRPAEAPAREWLERLCSDSVGVEVAVAYGAGGCLPAHAVRPERPVLGADRQAWIAFNRGDLVLCRKLLALAPARSLVRLFLEARLARLDGDFVRAAGLLQAWLDEYRRKGSEVTGYGIIPDEDAYWQTTGKRDDYENSFGGKAFHVGPFGPSGAPYEYGIGNFFDRVETASPVPTLPRVVSGELGMVMVASRDLEEALYAFLLARNWIDVAFVAERCMTVDELVKFMGGGRGGARDKILLRGLLMRRLMRCGRLQEAALWAPRELKPLCDEFIALSAAAHDEKADADVRALAFLNLGRLTATRGMELMGTELRPDAAIYGGLFDTDAVPIAAPTELSARLCRTRDDARWAGWGLPGDRVQRRFHYRLKAAEYARNAVRLAKNADVRAWSLMLGGVCTLSQDDAQAADWFYKRLATMRHPRAKVGGWFNSPAYTWFKTTYYDDERHAPLRVPRRFTLEQLGKLGPSAK